MRWMIGSKDVLSDRPILAFPKVFITLFSSICIKSAHFLIALPTRDHFYLMGKKEKKKSSCISLINGEVEVLFLSLLATFIMDCFFMSFIYNSFSVGLCVDICCWVVFLLFLLLFSIFPHPLVTESLFIVGNSCPVA